MMSDDRNNTEANGAASAGKSHSTNTGKSRSTNTGKSRSSNTEKPCTRNTGKSPSQITQDICKHEGHLILEAGAGTGKTYNLTERVIHHLLHQEVPLERMLALTFTDFAAGEMRSRIYAAINKNIGINISKADHLLTTRRRFSRNYISTFHSFCNRILNYFPDEITEISVSESPRFLGDPGEKRNIDGAFELLSDYDEVLWMMEWRKRFYQKYKDHEGLQRQLTRLPVSVFEQFMKDLSGEDEAGLLKLASMTPDVYLEKMKGLSDIWRKECDAMLENILKEMAAHPEWFRSPDKIPGNRDELASIKNKGKGFSRRIFSSEHIDDAALEDINLRGDELFELLNMLELAENYLSDPERAQQLKEYPDQDEFNADHEAYWNMRDLAELSLRWSTLMRYQRFDAGLFNYDDMIWLTHRLFAEKPGVVTRMRSRFDQILVDEFQDTDRRQWEIIRKLAFDGPDKKQMLIVGDVKQAIYGFRGGDVAMMRYVKNELESQAGSPDPLKQNILPLNILPLPYSFRSNKAVISFANRLFKNIFGQEGEVTSYEAHHQPLETPPAQLSENADAPGEVRILIADCKKLAEELENRQAGN